MATHLALLRGINVGGKNILPMKELTAIFEGAGCREVRTFIQSGNVIFAATPRVCGNPGAVIGTQIEKTYGYRTPVIVRTKSQLRDAVVRNPFPGEEERLHVMFLQDRPGARQIALLDPDRSTPDRFLVRGSEIYLHLPNGVGRSRLTNTWFDTKLATVSTLRNWRTVTKLLDLMDEY